MTASAADPVLVVERVVKEYGALRPLRIQALTVDRGGLVAILGLDAPAAEMFINLATGATLPDEGRIKVEGADTSAIQDPDEWLRSLDRFGIMSDRAVLLEQLTVAQNLAMTLTLAVEPMDAPTRAAVEPIAVEAGLTAALLDTPVGSIEPLDRARLRLARAVALGPSLLLLEHPTASVPAALATALAADVRRVASARRLAAVAITADSEFASALTEDVRTLVAATGELASARPSGWRGLRRLLGG